MRQEHGWRLTVDGYRLNSWTPVPTENRGSERSRFVRHTALKETDSGLKQWALYHYIASLGDGTADTDGWLTMTVHDGGFKHTAQKAEHISKGQSLPLLWWLVAFFPGSLSPGLLLAIACTITYLTRWKERGTIRFIPELVHNLASALALRAPLATHNFKWVKITDSRLTWNQSLANLNV